MLTLMTMALANEIPDLGDIIPMDPTTVIPPPGACDKYLTDQLKAGLHDLDSQARAAMTNFSDEQEKVAGAELAAELERTELAGKLNPQDPWQGYLEEVLAEVLKSTPTPRFNYTITFVDDPTENAFALPGGHLYFYRGILEKVLKNEAQLAVVIGHEVGHVELYHCAALFQYMSEFPMFANDLAAIGLSMARHTFSSTQELDSDRFGLAIAHSAHYDGAQAELLWEGWGSPPSEPVLPILGVPVPDLGGLPIPVDILAEVENMTISHPSHEARACVARETYSVVGQRYPVQNAYVGERNYTEKVSRARKRYQ